MFAPAVAGEVGGERPPGEQVGGGEERQAGAGGCQRDGGVQPAARLHAVEVARRVGVQEGDALAVLAQRGEQVAIFKIFGGGGVGLGAVVVAQLGGHVAPGEQCRLAGGRLRQAAHAQAGIQAQQAGVPPMVGRRSAHQAAPIQQALHGGQAEAGQGIGLRIVWPQADAIQEDEQHSHAGLL